MEEEAQALLGAASDLQHGALRIGADGPFHVMPVLARLREAHPALQLSVTVGNSADVERRLLDVQSDVAILAHSSDDERLYARRIARHPVIVFVSKKHAWAKLGRIKLAELAGEPMVVREAGSATRRMFDALTKRRNVTPNVVLEIESREAMREAVAAGFGFGVVSAPELGFDDRLASIEITDGTVFTEEHAVCLHDRRQDKAIRAFFSAALHGA
jgi:DNA-binding transcriptional LysR family regulator